MIRAVGPADLLRLRHRLPAEQPFYTEQLLAEVHRPFWFGLRSMLAAGRGERVTWIGRDGTDFAVLQARGRAGRAEQDLVFLASDRPAGGHLRMQEFWFRLLEHWTAAAAESYLERLYVGLPQGHDELREIFRQAGFRPYTQQVILCWAGDGRVQPRPPTGIRPQARRDPWAIQQLYERVTPQAVQQVEMRNARSWAAPAADGLLQRRHAWLLEQHDEPAAYLQMRSGPAGHVFSLLLHPALREAAESIIGFGLAQISDKRRVWLVLRAYQQDLLPAVERLGFQPVGDQDLLVRVTASAVRRSVFASTLERRMNARLNLQR